MQKIVLNWIKKNTEIFALSLLVVLVVITTTYYNHSKKITERNFLLSSLIGMSINSILFLNYFIGFNYYNNSIIQIVLISSSILLYLISYYYFDKKLG